MRRVWTRRGRETAVAAQVRRREVGRLDWRGDIGGRDWINGLRDILLEWLMMMVIRWQSESCTCSKFEISIVAFDID